MPDDSVDSTTARVGGAEAERPEPTADDGDERGWPGPIDEPPPLFS